MRGSAIVRRANFSGTIQFARPTNGHDRAEDHHQRVHRRHLVEEVRLHELQARMHQLGADHAEQRTDAGHREREDQVQCADGLGVGRTHPTIEEAVRLVVVIVLLVFLMRGVGSHGVTSKMFFLQSSTIARIKKRSS
jgi:hypothetical protein